MQHTVIDNLYAFPQKLTELACLEEELHDVLMDDTDLSWNAQRRCVEHKFNDDPDVEYTVLQHWAEHVGASFELTEDIGNDGYYHAFIYQ